MFVVVVDTTFQMCVDVGVGVMCVGCVEENAGRNRLVSHEHNFCHVYKQMSLIGIGKMFDLSVCTLCTRFISLDIFLHHVCSNNDLTDFENCDLENWLHI